MEKIKFPKSYIELTTDDLSVPDAEGVAFRFWDNPSKFCVEAIMEVVGTDNNHLAGKTPAELEVIDRNYLKALSMILMDCNIEGLDFSTPENVDEAFRNPDLPIGFLHHVVVAYISYLFDINTRVKKASALYLIQSGFGDESKKVESESKATSSETQNQGLTNE